MTSRWLVSVPVWGERCVDVFCAVALPALERAVGVLEAAGCDARLVVHSDQHCRIRASATEVVVEDRPVPAGLRDFDCLSQAHREVMSMACAGDVVVLLTADLVISERGLAHCARVLEDSQKMLVMCAGVRALQEGQVPGTDGQVLMDWAWSNRHPMTEACCWPHGDSADLSRTYFERDGCVAARLALPHPLAVRIDGRPLRFTPTVDANLIQCFAPHEAHVVADCGDLALVELSPRDKDYGRSHRTISKRLAEYEFRVGDPMQRRCFEQRVTLVGPPGRDCGDGEVVRRVLAAGG